MDGGGDDIELALAGIGAIIALVGLLKALFSKDSKSEIDMKGGKLSLNSTGLAIVAFGLIAMALPLYLRGQHKSDDAPPEPEPQREEVVNDVPSFEPGTDAAAPASLQGNIQPASLDSENCRTVMQDVERPAPGGAAPASQLIESASGQWTVPPAIMQQAEYSAMMGVAVQPLVEQECAMQMTAQAQAEVVQACDGGTVQSFQGACYCPMLASGVCSWEAQGLCYRAGGEVQMVTVREPVEICD